MLTTAIIDQMLDQFHARHQRPPQAIVITPLACLALAVKQNLAAVWRNVPVICRDIQETEATREPALAMSLAVFVRPEGPTARLVCCDLKT